MRNIVKNRKEFNKAFGLKTNKNPTSLNKDRVNLHYDLMKEELDEYLESAIDRDILGTADAIVDIFYVLTGAAAEHGMLDVLELMFEEVHRSNMSKLGDHGMPIYREDGKVLKGKNFTAPDLKSILDLEKTGVAQIKESDVDLIEKIYKINLNNHSHDSEKLKKDYSNLISKLQKAIHDEW